MITCILCIAAYLAIGLILALLPPNDTVKIGAILLWPLGLDIQLNHWFVIRGIERRSARRLAETIAKRDASLRLIKIEYVVENGKSGFVEASVTMGYDDEVDTWRGSGASWHRVPDGETASEWLSKWLHERATHGFLGTGLQIGWRS